MSRKKKKKKKRKTSSSYGKPSGGSISSKKFPFDVDSELTRAVEYSQSRQFEKVQEICFKILRIDRNHPKALYLLGIVFYQAGEMSLAIDLFKKAILNDPGNPNYPNVLGNAFLDQNKVDEAVRCFQKAVELDPTYPEAHYNMGNAFLDDGRLREAVECYQEAIKLNPTYVEAYYNMGNALESEGDPEGAISSYQKAVGLRPEFSEAYYNMGNALHAQGKVEEAISCLRKAITLSPEWAEAYNNLASALQSVEYDRSEEAISYWRRAVGLKPDYVEAYYNMGNALQVQGKSDEAISCWYKAVELKSDYAEAYFNIGNTFLDQGRLEDAIAYCQKASQLKPNFAEAYNSLGVGLMLQDRRWSAEAVSYLRKATELKPDWAEAYSNMGVAFVNQGKSEEAISCFKKALELVPDFHEVYSNLVHQIQQTCAWQELEKPAAKLDDLTRKELDAGRKSPEYPFLGIVRHADPSHNLAVARSWSSDLARSMSREKIIFPFSERGSSTREINIGYLSNDFCNHATAHLMQSLFELHNRDEFKIFCYSHGEDDRSSYRVRIEQDCDKFVDLRNLSHADAAKQIYADQVDILVDLKGHTKENRLAICALRPAPIQVAYLGFPGTTGADFFDYIITDRIVTPENHAQYYSENFAYLPHCYQVNDHTQPISDKHKNGHDFGLPESAFVFCSFSQGYKIDPVMFDTWMEVLSRVPESVLWLSWENVTAERNLKQEARARGVDATRLIFGRKLPKDEHLGRISFADLALDTRIVNGHTTTSDALWAGVPVITLEGSHFASRVSASILTAIGLPELITHSLEEYRELAVRLATNPDELKEIREKLSRNRLTEPLFDTPRFARNLEKAYKEMWEIFRAGQNPRQIEVVES